MIVIGFVRESQRSDVLVQGFAQVLIRFGHVLQEIVRVHIFKVGFFHVFYFITDLAPLFAG